MGIKLGDAILFLKTDSKDLDKGLKTADKKTRGWASGLKGFVGNTLSFAAGGIITNVVSSVGRFTAGLAKEALGELANYERLSMSLQTLSQAEMLRMSQTGQGVEAWFERTIGLTSEQSGKVTELAAEYNRLNDLMGKYEDPPQRLQEQWAKTTKELWGYIDATGQGTDAMFKMAIGTLDMEHATDLVGNKAQDLVKWIEMLAVKSPFDQAGVADAFRTAMAYGFATEEAQRLTEATLNFAAGSGATSESMGRLGLALGQMHAKGKLTGEELRQMTEAGVPALNMLATHYGKTTAEIQTMISKGLVPADEAFEAIVGTMETQFAGAAEAQATSWAGLTNTFEDLKAIGLRELFKGAAEALKPLVVGFADWLESGGMEQLQEWGANIGDFIAGVIEFAQGLPEKFGVVKEFFGDLLGGDTAGVASFLEGLGIPDWVIGSVETLMGAFENMKEFWAGEGGTAIKEQSMEKLQGLWDTLSGLAQDIIPWITEQFEKISQWFVDNGELIAEYQEKFHTVFMFLVEVVQGVWVVIEPILSGIVDLVIGIAKTIMQVATGDWKGAWETLKGVVSDAWEAIKEFFKNFVNWVLGWMGSDIEQFKKDWENAWEQVKRVAGLIWDKIKEKFETWVSGVKEWGKNIIDGLVEGINNAKEKVFSKIKEIVDRIKELFDLSFLFGSPSKVTSQYGEWIGEGLAVGIEAQKESVIAAVTDMVDGMQTALQVGAEQGASNSNTDQRQYNFYGVQYDQQGNILDQLAEQEFLYG